MARIQIGGAGGAPSNGVVRSLRESSRADYLIGMSSSPTDLFLADVDERHTVPPASDPRYGPHLMDLLDKCRPAFLHAQNDFEVRAISRMRTEISKLGIKTFLPSAETVENCVDKFKTYEIWRQHGLKVPQTKELRSPADLVTSFSDLGATIWIRAKEGGGGYGALPTDDLEFARRWIERFEGWGSFTASELLTDQSVTWLSIWNQGELVVAQARKRRAWNFGSRTLSGVTGVTGVAETIREPLVDEVARAAILAVDAMPHGIFGVDMTYDQQGIPNPTEINIGRFFTTVYFFTKAGLNMPEIYCNLALENKGPDLETQINPLRPGLVWIRGMDVAPVLTSVEELETRFNEWSV